MTVPRSVTSGLSSHVARSAEGVYGSGLLSDPATTPPEALWIPTYTFTTTTNTASEHPHDARIACFTSFLPRHFLPLILSTLSKVLRLQLQSRLTDAIQLNRVTREKNGESCGPELADGSL